jgi:hypothetical protein
MRHFRSLRARRRESLAVPGELEWFIIERIKKAATEVAGCTIEVWQEAKMEVLLHWPFDGNIALSFALSLLSPVLTPAQALSAVILDLPMASIPKLVTA